MANRQVLTLDAKKAIVGALLSGATQTELARQYGVDRRSISRLKHKIADSELVGKVAMGDVVSWKASHKTSAINAVQRALDAPPETQELGLKQASLGVQVLKGLGEYSDGSAKLAVGFQAHFEPANIPLAYRDEFLKPQLAEEVIDITSENARKGTRD